MADTPNYYIQVLDLITAPKEPSAREVGALEARHLRALREIFADKNMVGIGVSEKVTERRNTGRLCVTFYVQKKIPASRLGIRKSLPQVIAAPGGQAVFTDIKVIGKIVPEINRQPTPVQSGFSVGHKSITFGTLGAIVRKGNDFFILSNSHVLAKSGTARIGDTILYPAKGDNGVLGTHDVATLSEFKKFTLGGDFVNRCDAAIAKILPGRIGELIPSIPGIAGAPGIMAPTIGMKVVLKGRSGVGREGLVQDVNFRTTVPYDEFANEVGFLDQVLCTRYTRDGDSGAIVVAKDFGKIVGLHFAGSATESVFSPIQPVIDALGFQFINPGME